MEKAHAAASDPFCNHRPKKWISIDDRISMYDYIINNIYFVYQYN